MITPYRLPRLPLQWAYLQFVKGSLLKGNAFANCLWQLFFLLNDKYPSLFINAPLIFQRRSLIKIQGNNVLTACAFENKCYLQGMINAIAYEKVVFSHPALSNPT